MSNLQFETPENVAVNFVPAGLGTRFVAWVVDQILSTMLMFAILLLLACTGVSFHAVEEIFRDLDSEERPEAVMYAIGLVMLIWGLGSFFYFGVCELMLRGQTPGKRMSKIRVVKIDGFALDAASILVRNVFRVLDHVPPLWLVPLLSARCQRAGDMVAGTVVVSDEVVEVSSVRTELTERTALESEYRFDGTALSRLTEQDIRAIQTLLERWDTLPWAQREQLTASIVSTLSTKLKVEAPLESKQLRFLEDVLAAELRRQHRGLG